MSRQVAAASRGLRGRRAVLLLVVLGTVWGIAPRPVVAGGFSNLDFGIRRLGMFAVTARPDDVTAIFHNPAGLTLLEGTQLYHSQSWFISGLGFKMYDSEGKLRPEDHEIKPSWSVGVIPFFGMSSDLNIPGFRVGLGIYAPNAYGAALPVEEPTRYHAVSALFVASRFTASVAYEFTDEFRVGMSLSMIHVYMTSTSYMNVLMMADQNWDRRFDPREDTRETDAKLELTGQDVTIGWDIGVLFKPFDSLYIGAAFSAGAPIDLTGTVRYTLPGQDTQVVRHKTGMVIPFTLRVGVNWEFAPNFQIAADIYWWHYEVFQEQRSVLSEPIAGTGIDEMISPKNYGDSWNWCIGLLYKVLPTLEVMMGYQEDYTPIPNDTFTLDNPSRDQRGIAVGIRWQITEDLRVGVAYVRNWFKLPNVQTSIAEPPANIKGHGGNDEFGFEILWKL